MPATISIGIALPSEEAYVEVLQVILAAGDREVELYSTDYVDNLDRNDFLDEVGKCLNEAILWQKELMYLPEIVVVDTVLNFAEEIEDGLSKKILQMKGRIK